MFDISKSLINVCVCGPPGIRKCRQFLIVHACLKFRTSVEVLVLDAVVKYSSEGGGEGDDDEIDLEEA
jgi:hypothetical protein